MQTDAGSLAAFAVPGILVPTVLAARNVFGSGRRQAERWATSERVTLTEATFEPVRRHLKRIRCARSLAGLPLWWLATVRMVKAEVPAALATPYPALIAYVVAGLAAELTSPLLGTDAIPRASLVPRNVADYLPTWLRALALGLVTSSAAALAGSWPVADRASTIPPALHVGLAVAAIACAEVAVRRIVHRPQRTGDTDVLAADDALRATSVAMVYAVALLAGLSAASSVATVVMAGDPGWRAAPIVLVQLTLGGLQVGVLIGLVRQETWGYRRRHQAPSPQAALAPPGLPATSHGPS